MSRIAVVDYGMGNLRSVSKAIERVAPKSRVIVTGAAAEIDAADRVVLPGQGAMRDCVKQLQDSDAYAAVLRAARSRPLLGICVGEQMLFEFSEEGGGTAGLGLLAGRVGRFPDAMRTPSGARLKVPHMGWNRVWRTGEHPLWHGVADGSYFYFVHSYCAEPADSGTTAAFTDYGIRFTCAVASANIFATQFHPEKSAETGLKIYENFVSWRP
jgi:glutamine amidotransferase